MKILFLQRDPFIKIGIETLSAVLKNKGHSCDILVDSLEKDMVSEALRINPEIIAFSTTTTEYSWMNEIGRKIRKEFKNLMICGGPHATFYPDVIQEDYLDLICVGEGDRAIADLADALEKKQDITNINNLIIKKEGKTYRNELGPLISDLDSLPFPDRSVYNKYKFFRDQKNKTVLTGRGCPYHCTFCFNKKYNDMYKNKGMIVRKRRSEEVIREIKQLIRENPVTKYISFADDTFVLSGAWINEFSERYKKEINLPFCCSVRANLINEDLVRNLKKANCWSIKLGIESGNEYFRNSILKKGVTDKQIMESTDMIKKYGIRLLTHNILGVPEETLETAFQTFELNKKIHPTYAWCSLMHPYPGTEIYEYMSNSDYLDKNYDFKEFGNSYFMDLPIKIANKNEISNFQKIFALGVWLRLPKKLVRALIGFRLGKFYEIIFKLNYAIGISRIHNIGFPELIKTALLSGEYFDRIHPKTPRKGEK